MIKAYNTKSLAWGIPGIVLQFASGGIQNEAMNLILVVVGTAMLIAGLAYYAKGKGRTPAWGLMGLFSILGLIVLALLPDLEKGAPPNP